MYKRFTFLFVLGLSLFFVSRMPVVEATQSEATPQPTSEYGAMGDMSGDDLPLETAQLIDSVRGETAQYRDLDTALKDGYGKFETCFHFGDNLGMGQHYVNGSLAGDDVVDPMKPEALVYEPLKDGSMILVAFEYLVFADKWDPDNTGREAPTVFGQPMMLLTNIPDTSPVWGLHLWLYSGNPDGLFSSFNPLVSCPDAPDNIDMSTR